MRRLISIQLETKGSAPWFLLGVGGGGYALRTFCQVAAVVVCLDEALGVVGVDVEGVEVGADALDWGEVLFGTVSQHPFLQHPILCIEFSCLQGCCPHLSHSCTCLEHFALGGALIPSYVSLWLCHVG
jgi:hypothetical protein